MVLQQQIFDLRHDGISPVFQNLCEVEGAVCPVCWRPEKENELGIWVSKHPETSRPSHKTTFCSPSLPTSSSDPQAVQQLTERMKRNSESFIFTARTASNCCKQPARPRLWGVSATWEGLSAPPEPSIVEVSAEMWEQSCAMTSHQCSVAREEGLLRVSGGLCNATLTTAYGNLKLLKAEQDRPWNAPPTHTHTKGSPEPPNSNLCINLFKKNLHRSKNTRLFL